MFEYEGQQYTKEEVEKAAKEKNLSVEDYVKQFEITSIEEPSLTLQNLMPTPGKTKPTTPGAVVEEKIAPTTTEPPLEDISLDSLDADVKTGKVGDEVTVERIRKEAQVQNKLLFENIDQINITSPEVIESTVNTYFGLENGTIPKKFVPGTSAGIGAPGGYYTPQSPEEYFSEQSELLVEYNDYITNGVLPENNKIQNIEEETVGLEKEKAGRLFLENVPESVQRYMVPIGGDKIYNQDPKQLEQGLLDTKKWLDTINNELEIKQKNFDEKAKPYIDQLDNVLDKIKNIAGDDLKMDNLDSPKRKKQYNQLVKEAQQIELTYQTEVVDKIGVPLAKEIENYNTTRESFEPENLNPKLSQLQSLNTMYRALSLDYSTTNNIMHKFDDAFIGGALNFGNITLQAGREIAKYVSPAYSLIEKIPALSAVLDKGFDLAQDTTRNYNIGLEKRGEKFPPPIKIDDIGKNGIGIGNFVFDVLQENSATLATVMPLGVVPSFGVKATQAARLAYQASKGVKAQSKALKVLGSAYRKQQADILAAQNVVKGSFFVQEGGGKQREMDLKESQNPFETANYTVLQKGLTTYLYGGIATLAESLGSIRLVSGMGSIASKMGRQSFKEAAYTNINFSKNIVNKVVSGLSPLMKSTPIEWLEETATEIGHRVVDIAVLKENKSLLEGIDLDYFANITLTSFAMMSPKVANGTFNMLKNEFRIKSEIKKAQELRAKITGSIEKSKNPNLTQGQLLIEYANQKQLLKEMVLEEVLTIDKLAELSSDEIKTVGDINRQQREVMKQIVMLGESGEVDSEGQAAKQRLFDQWDTLDNQKESILNTKKRKNVKDEKDTFEELRKQLGIEPNNKESQYYMGLYDFYTRMAMTMQPEGGSFIYINSQKDLDDLIKDSTYTPEQKIQLKNMYNQDGVPVAYGMQIGGTNDIVINNNLARIKIAMAANEDQAMFAAASPIHELFHIYNKSKNIVDKNGKLSDEAQGAVSEAEITLENKAKLNPKKYKKALDIFKKRKKKYEELAKTESKKVDSEEVMAIMNDMALLGALDISDMQGLPSFKSLINNIAGQIFGDANYLFDLKTSEDVFNFIKNYRKNIDNTTTVNQIPDDEDEVSKMSISIGKQLENAIPEGMTQKEYKEEGWKNVLAEVMTTDVLDGVIKKQLQRQGIDISGPNANVYNQSIDNFIEDVKGSVELQNTIKRWDGRGSIGGFIVTELQKYRIGDISNKLKPFADTNSLNTSDVVGNEKITNIVDTTETIDETIDKTDKKVERVLLDEKIPLSQESKDEVINVVKNLLSKGRIPKTDTKEFTKYIDNNLKNELKPIMAKFIGKNTDESLETFLRNSFKKGLYEGIPQSIINKRFSAFKEPVLDKDGKQVREKTKQGNAVFKKKNITPAEWVKYFIGRDVGASTKGTRKDALAETLAVVYGNEEIIKVLEDANVQKDFLERQSLKPKSEQQTIKDVFEFVNENYGIQSSKFSLAEDLKGAPLIKLLEAIEKDGLAEVFLAPGKISNQYDEDIRNLDSALIDSIYDLYEKGQIKDKNAILYGARIALSDDIPSEIKRIFKEAGNFAKDEDQQEALIEDIEIVVNALGKEVTDFIGFDVFGFTLKSGLDPAKRKELKSSVEARKKVRKENKIRKEKGEELELVPKKVYSDVGGKYYPTLQKIKDGVMEIASPEDIKKILPFARKMNKAFSLFQKFSNKNAKGIITGIFAESNLDKKIAMLIELQPEIEAANAANIELATYFSQTVNELYRDGKIKASSVLRLYQLQTSATGGLRALTRLTDITLENKPQLYNIKGEHLAPNANTMSGLAIATLNPKISLEESNALITQQYNNHNQWITDDALTKVVDDKLGKTSTLNRNRLFALPLSDLKNVFTYQGGSTMKQLVIQKSAELVKRKNNEILPPDQRLKDNYDNTNVLTKASLIDQSNLEQEKKFSLSADLSKGMNDIIQAKTGIASEKTYSRVKAEVVGANKGRFDFFIPPSAEDFTGLLYKTLSKSKLGDSQMAWYKAHLLNPFARAMDNISRDRVALQNDFKALKKELKGIPKTLKKKVPGEGFTQEQAVRSYIWDKQGMTIPGLAGTDIKTLVDFVAKNPDLVTFADQLIAMQKGDQYAAPNEGWLAGNITTDLMDGINTVKRAKYLEVWQQNADQIFSEANLNKLEAAYGKDYRVALENSLQRMKTGKNRSFGGDTLTGRVTDWLTNSIGAIMFFNTRSAVLQTISAINFINFGDNNIYKAGKAFANQKQYWKDFKTLFNSDFLVERRDGLRLNVNEADIADMAKKGGVRGVISELLRLGFLPTQIADSFAIAAGGSTFYRNRLKALEKQGMSKTEAEAKAFQDFRETAEESQQSSRPDRISQQQAGPLGRVILAFANTPAQYARLIKKAASDLKNRRGDDKTNISKILYYGVAQNLIFNALQQALFGLAFGDEEEPDDKKEKRYINVANGMSDSLLRGLGLGGAVFSVLKNTALRLNQEADKKRPKYQDILVKEILQISPPISSKVGKLKAAGRSYSWNKKEMMEKGWSLDNPAYLAAGQVIAATTNIPLDRAFKKIDNIRNASNSDLEAWQRIASIAGWSAWELGINDKSSKSVSKLTDKEKLIKLTKAQQVDSLLSLGISKKQINKLKLESDRVQAILNPKSIKKEKLSKKDSLFGLNKKQQVAALIKLGFTKKEIRALTLESDRVNTIISKEEITIK